MPLYNRGTVQDAVQLYRGRHRYMADSINAVDRANAEAYRLAANLLQEMANDMIGEAEPPDPETYVARLREAWDKYLKTGIIDDDLRAVEMEHRLTLVKGEKGEPVAPETPRRPRLERELREHIAPMGVESIVSELSRMLGIAYTPPPGEPEGIVASGLVGPAPGQAAAQRDGRQPAAAPRDKKVAAV